MGTDGDGVVGFMDHVFRIPVVGYGAEVSCCGHHGGERAVGG